MLWFCTVLLAIMVLGPLEANATGSSSSAEVRNLRNEVNWLKNSVTSLSSRLNTVEGKLNPSVRTCPSAWKRYGNSCYGMGTEPVSWGAAQEMCRIYGGHLAEIDSWGENEFARGMARSYGFLDIWLGGVDVFADGNWVWATDGRPVSYSNWQRGQRTHNNGGSQDCMEMYRSGDYKWYDEHCHKNFHFLCEVRLA